MRARVMAVAQKLGMLVQAHPIQDSRLNDASEIFITNAIQGIQPVGSVAETTYISKHHKVMSTIRDAVYGRSGLRHSDFFPCFGEWQWSGGHAALIRRWHRRKTP
jgi:hypothetical protein